MDAVEPDMTVTLVGVAHGLGTLAPSRTTVWTPGETMNVKGVDRPMDTPSILMVAPVGSDVTDSFPGVGGLWDNRSAGSSKTKYIIANFGSIRGIFTSILLGEISPQKLGETENTDQHRGEL